MLFNGVTIFLAYVAVASSRETYRPLPTITNSLVNLGKMEIAFHFDGYGRDTPLRPSSRVNAPVFMQKSDAMVEEPCPCSTNRNVKDILGNPAGLLNQILMNNNLFSSHKDPFTSTLCCESHEHIQEGTVVFEFPANPKNMKPSYRKNNMPTDTVRGMPMQMPMMPFLFENPIPNKGMLPQLKTKSIEIFLIPKKKESGFEAPKLFPKKKDLLTKDNIQVVGDKELRNDVNLFTLEPPVVKKDLNQQEKNEKSVEQATEKDVIIKEDGDQLMIIEPGNKPNAVKK